MNHYPLHGYGCAGAVTVEGNYWDRYCYGVHGPPDRPHDMSWFEKCCKWDGEKCIPKRGKKVNLQ